MFANLYKCLFQTTDKELALFLRGRLDPARFQKRRASGAVHEPGTSCLWSKDSAGAVSASLSQRRFSMEVVCFSL